MKSDYVHEIQGDTADPKSQTKLSEFCDILPEIGGFYLFLETFLYKNEHV